MKKIIKKINNWYDDLPELQHDLIYVLVLTALFNLLIYHSVTGAVILILILTIRMCGSIV